MGGDHHADRGEPQSTMVLSLRDPDLRAAYAEFLMLQESLMRVQYDVTALGGDPALILQNLCNALGAVFASLVDDVVAADGHTGALQDCSAIITAQASVCADTHA